ncbi:polysaccharide lyase family protein [Aridibaculum aurantiacum]|uniref:polysaccharide lyase family protein n=1 Tax=Aridibaculum aurantiacum TaxID=2810307 RepID=UPI001A96A457|nr:polysaccharide lyase family protein [Aridibaculum aurantiacum]
MRKNFSLIILTCISLLLSFHETNAQVTNWIGGVSSDYFNKHNWSDTNLNFTSLNSWRLRIGAGNPNTCTLNGGNSSNVSYRPDRINTLGGGTFICNGAVYPYNNDSLNGTVILNAPADFNIRNIAYIGNREAANVTINGGSLTTRHGMVLAANGGSAVVTVAGGSLTAGSGGSNMDLSIANGAGLSAQLNITGGSVKVSRNLVIGTGGSIFISGIGQLVIAGDKVAQLNALVADGRLTCTPGKVLSITYNGTNTTALISQNPNSMIREFPDSVVLSNGIITANIAKRSGNINSLRYNGIEQLNQLGSSRKGAYHDFQTSYGFETMNNCVYTIKTETDTIVDISLKRLYNPTTGQVTPADADMHYVLIKGDTALYTYSILEHKADYPAFDLGSWRLVEWIAQDGTNYLCEKIYVDSLRKWQMPSVYDFNNASATSIAEIVKLNTGVRAGKFDGKYQYSAPFWDVPVWGHASDVNHIGTWVVLNTPEYVNGGPLHQDLVAAAGINHVLLNGLHYGDKAFVIPQGESWKKVYGPYLLYTTSKPTADENWAAAKVRGEAEKAKWPYKWLTNTPEYPLAHERGSVSGKFIVSDVAKPTVTGANAWVGLTIISNADNQWQHEGKNYHYWVKTDAAGNFTIPNIRPGTYSFFAYTDGEVGDYRLNNISVTAGQNNNIGNVTWTIPRNFGNLLWEIGIPNKKANEFRLGKFDYCEGFVERKFRDTFPAIIEYDVAQNDWATKIPYAHTKYPDVNGAPGDTWKWRINFTLPQGIPTTGNARLTIAYASTDHAQQWIYVNSESSTFTTYFPENGDGNAFIRQANYGKYSHKEISIPMSRLRSGSNTITLVMPSNSLWVSHHMYDYISLEAPVSGALPVSLLSFTARAINTKEVATNWTTTSEINTRNFVVERSIDGNSFSPIGTIQARGTAVTNTTYSFTDKNPLIRTGYYRLKMVDVDGSFTYSAIRQVKLANEKITLYPNPVVKDLVVKATEPIISVRVIDTDGRTQLIKAAAGNQVALDLSTLVRGVYMVEVTTANNVVTEKVWKQ